MEKFHPRWPRAVVVTIVAGVALILPALPGSAEPTWLEPTILHSSATEYVPSVTVNARGDALATWMGPEGVQAARRPVGGAWSAPMTISAGPEHSDHVQATLDANGDAIALWQTWSPSGEISLLRYARQRAGETWSEPAQLGTDGAFAPDLALDGAGNAVAVWGELADKKNRVRAAFLSRGGTWSQADVLADRRDAAHYPVVVADGQGGFDAVWSVSDASGTRLEGSHRATDGTWNGPVTIADPGPGASDQQIATDGRGGVTATWTADDGANYRVYVAERQLGSSWGPATPISDVGYSAVNPAVAVSGSGARTVAWTMFVDNNDHGVVRARSRTGNGDWSAPVTVSNPEDHSYLPRLGIDARGGAVAVWDVAVSAVGEQLQAARLPAGGAWSEPAGLAQDQGGTAPAITVDDEGNAIVAWNADGQGSSVLKAVTLDAAGPTTTASQPSSTWQTATSFPVAWLASDRWSEVTSADVQYRVAPWNGGFGSTTTWKSATSATSATFAGSAGRTYCLSARSRDSVGNVGAWSAERCTSTPIDDRTLATSGSWYRGTSSSFYAGTYTRSKTKGAALTRTGVQGRQLALLVSTCSSCGSVRVTFNGATLGTYSLFSTTTVRRKIIQVATFATVRTGTVKVQVTSATGKAVYIDGLAVKR